MFTYTAAAATPDSNTTLPGRHLKWAREPTGPHSSVYLNVLHRIPHFIPPGTWQYDPYFTDKETG